MTVSPIPLRWLDDAPPARLGGGATWGVPLPRGVVASTGRLGLREVGGDAVPAQFWPLATWPDGSVKWAGCAVGALESPAQYEVQVDAAPPASTGSVAVRDSGDEASIH